MDASVPNKGMDAGAPDVVVLPPDARTVDAYLADALADAGGQAEAALPACRTIGAPSAGTYAGCYWDLPFVGDPAACGLNVPQPPVSLCDQLCWNGDAGAYPLACALWDSDGGLMLDCSVGCEGRRPTGLRGLAIGPPARSRVGDQLVRAAYLEAASVHAFRILERELAFHGGPERLVRAARAAGRDEVRHTLMMAALARRFGATAVLPRYVPPEQARPLEDIAIENATEGCVRETYGALVAGWQASAARDRTVRPVMARIARDEARHAELSWRVARWVDRQLDPGRRDRARAATRTAVAELARELRREPHGDLVRELGVPRAPEAARLHAELERALWS